MQCNYCVRDYACVNESRPGVTSTILTPLQAAGYLDEVAKKIKNIKVVGIAGPGEPFANGVETMETLRLVRERHPEMMLCVATNGLDLLPHIEELARLDVSHVTVTVNAVDAEVCGRIYAWARYGKRVYRHLQAGLVIQHTQDEAIRALKKKGITVKINTVVIPGVNDGHAVEVARRMAELGADIHNCMPLYHVAGTAFEDIAPPTREAMETLRASCRVHMPQMSHCSRCRADAAGMIGEAQSAKVAELLERASRPVPTMARPFVAVASMEGLFVNQHLGEAKGLWIYGMKDEAIDCLEWRGTPPPGGGMDRWATLADSLHDCGAVLASGIGPVPQYVLERAGLRVVVMEGLAREGIEAIFSGNEIPRMLLRTPGRCGVGRQCTGTGAGCG
jgi:nitrogen fixation protein NifB